MPTYTFSCGCGWQGDVRTGFDANNVSCPSCTATAHKESVYRVQFGGFARTPGSERDYRTEFKNSQEAGAELEYQHQRLRDATQIADLPAPPLYQMAKAKARTMKAKGATVDDLS